MLPQTFSESGKEASERQANYLILRTLENKLPQHLFQQILKEMSGTNSLPQRIRWDGKASDAEFSEIKMSHTDVDADYLPRLLMGANDPSQISKSGAGTAQSQAKNLSYHLKQLVSGKETLSKNVYAQLNAKRGRFGKIASTLASGSAPSGDRNKAFEGLELQNLERMKTVFCHADFKTNEVSSIFNVAFDKSGRFIISGADDGIIKIWDRESLTLQASLHGHQDFITDIDISKCNKFIATSGNDAQLILWDLASGTIVQRFEEHASIINRVFFFSPKLTQQQQKDGRIQQHYLFSCSDDGTVVLYDLTPLSQNQGREDSGHSFNMPSTQAEVDEFRARRSSRRQQDYSGQNPQQTADQKNPKIFTLKLTQSEFRPGQKNKKIDTLSINSVGLVLAGTNTGELFAWKVNLQRMQERQNNNNSSLSRYIGQFKLFKSNVGVQFTEFSPQNDHLLLMGSTDGQVRVWNTEVYKGGHLDLENDQSRLTISIDEKEGCIVSNPITVQNNDNSEESDYYEVIEKRYVHPIEGPRQILKNIKKGQCDMVKWSVHGRYVIASLTSQLENEEKKENRNAAEEAKDGKVEICRIKVWDSVNRTYVDDLARSSGMALKKNTWVLAPHPINEEILMTGSDGGQLLLWNLQSKRILKKFTQYGVYSIDTYVMDNPLDGKFSPDGRSFLVGSQLGTISLFAHKSLHYKYEATRVQQFFEYDQERQKENPFESVTKHPEICGFNLIPYETQPNMPLIGKFAIQHQNSIIQTREEVKANPIVQVKAAFEEFERGLAVAQGMGREEERYYKDQTHHGADDGFFNVQVLQEGDVVNGIPESSIAQGNYGEVLIQDHDESDLGQEIAMLDNRQAEAARRRVPSNRNAPSSQNSPPPRASRRLIRNDQLESSGRQLRARAPDTPDNVRRSGRNRNNGVQMVESDSEMRSRSDSRDNIMPSDIQSSEDSEYGSESEDSLLRHHSRRLREGRRRQNVHEIVTALDADRELRESRANRASRRRRLQDSPELAGEEESMDLSPALAPTSRIKRPESAEPFGLQFAQNGQDDENDDEAESEQIVTGGEHARRARQRRQAIEQSEENSFVEPISFDGTEEKKHSRSNRRRVISTSPPRPARKQQHRSNKKKTRQQVGDSIANEEDQDSDMEEESYGEAESSQVESALLPPKAGGDRMGVFTANQPDTDYKFIDEKRKVTDILKKYPGCDSFCAICQRADKPLVGPFCKYDGRDLVGQPIYLHKDCIEVSQFSYFRISDSQWVNIAEAIDQLVTHNSYQCERCQTGGATIQCYSCKRCFHGHLCSSLMTIDLSVSNKQVLPKKRKMQCLFCRNATNYKDFDEQKVPKFEDESHKDNFLLATWKKLDRDYLLQKTPPVREKDLVNSYVPQLNDLVYYFFQGHEDYLIQYSCFFFCGETEHIKQKQLQPWLSCPQIKEHQGILCRVAAIDYDFPSRRAVKLLKEYGKDSTSVHQKAELIQVVKLEVIQPKLKGFTTQKPLSFSVSLFPHTLSDFMVLKQMYEFKLKKFEEHLQSPSKIVRLNLKKGQEVVANKVEILQHFNPIEPTTCPNSLWKSIVCKVVTNEENSRQRRPGERPQVGQSRRGSLHADTYQTEQQDDDEIKRINFWDIQYPTYESDLCKLESQLAAFTDAERDKMMEFMTGFVDKKKDICMFFMGRVTEEIASDYRCIVPSDMYLQLIIDRLQSSYYRCQQQLFSDLDLITFNAKNYNGDENDITKEAGALVEQIRIKLKPFINEKAETVLAKKLQLAQIIKAETNARISTTGKETAPPLRRAQQEMSDGQVAAQYDQFRTRQRPNLIMEIEEVKVEELEPRPVNGNQRRGIVLQVDRQARQVQVNNAQPPAQSADTGRLRVQQRENRRDMSVSHNFGFSGPVSESGDDDLQCMQSSSYTENNNDVFKPPATRLRNRGADSQSAESRLANSLRNHLGAHSERNTELGKKRTRRDDSSSENPLENGQINGNEMGRSLRQRNAHPNKRQHI